MHLDSHQHFWQYNEQEYGWINDKMGVLRRDFLPEDLTWEQAKAGFDGSIAVQARQTIPETAWLLALASENEGLKGVVGWLDICSAGFEKQLEQYAEYPKLCGLRYLVQDEPNANFMLRNDFQRGLGLLKKYNLTYDILIFPQHLPMTCQLVKKFPDQAFVLDHIAKPFIKKGGLEPWAADIKRLASFENVFCKVSGMVTEADWQNWKKDNFVPYLDIVFEAFGPPRIMIGSDWPVCTVAATYEQVIQIVRDYISDLSASEQGEVLGETCQRFYLSRSERLSVSKSL